AAIIASASGVIGLYVSYYLGVASGAAIVLTSTLLFGLAWLLRTLKSAMLRSASEPKQALQTHV
ncbi:MAG: metal ABC transporter permease, partial [Anaerolineales bacterium]